MMKMFGGFSKAKLATDDIKKIVKEIQPKIEERTKEKYNVFEAISFKSQVVKGVNYVIKVLVGDETYIHIRIYVPLGNEEKKILEVLTKKELEDPLEISYK